MTILVLTLVTMGFFAGLVSLIVKLSGRAYPGQVTTSLGNELDYENPFPGWGARMFGLNTYFEKQLEGPPAIPFDRWSESRSR